MSYRIISHRMSCVLFVALPLCYSANIVGAPSDVPRMDEARQPYCGLRSLHTGMGALGYSLPFATLLRPENISTTNGSTLSDLARIAREHGFYAKPTGRLSLAALSASTCPVILHTAASLKSPNYQHWVLYMGTTASGQARIYDGDAYYELGPEELAARWDGVALFISNGPLSLWRPTLASLVQFAFYSSLSLLSVALLRAGLRRLSGYTLAGYLARSASGQIVTLLLVTCLAAHSYTVLHSSGYLSQIARIEAIQEMHLASFIPKLTFSQVASMVENKDVAFVDARYMGDYNQGHIPGAVNIEPTSSVESVRAALSGVDVNKKIVVYCQSNNCPYGIKVVRMLMRAGYQRVSVYKEGWNEWTTRSTHV